MVSRRVVIGAAVGRGVVATEEVPVRGAAVKQRVNQCHEDMTGYFAPIWSFPLEPGRLAYSDLGAMVPRSVDAVRSLFAKSGCLCRCCPYGCRRDDFRLLGQHCSRYYRPVCRRRRCGKDEEGGRGGGPVPEVPIDPLFNPLEIKVPEDCKGVSRPHRRCDG